MAEDVVKNKVKRRRRKKKKSVVDSAVRNVAVLSDGCNPELVAGAEFDGIFEMPIIKKPNKMIIPDNLVPFSKMDKADKKKFAVCEYENDRDFRELLTNPNEYITILKEYQGFIAPDCSVYRDMPLAAQITTDLANDEKCHIGKDKWGNDWHARNNEDGTQDWVEHRNQFISDGGRNQRPKTWDEATGLKYNPLRREDKNE